MRQLRYLALAALLVLPLAACDDDDGAVAPPVQGTVRGTVTIEGQPAQGVTVELRGATTRSTTTNANGGYEFTGVEAGAYSVEISGFPADASFQAVSRTAVIATAGQEVTVDFSGQFIRTSSIVVTVSAGGQALAGVTVSLTGAGSATGTTNAAGVYTATGLRAGTYTVAISGTPAGTTFTTVSQNVTVGVGQTATVGFTGNRPSTTTVAIAGIVNQATGLPVNPTAVAGVITVTLAVDPGLDTPQRLEAFLNNEQVYTQTFSQAAPAEGEEAQAPFTVSFSVNTADFDPQTGAVRFPNGPYVISARFQTVEGGQVGAVQTQTDLTFANMDVVLIDVVPGASAFDAGGLQWVGQGIDATFIHVAYSGQQATNFNSSFATLGRTTNPAVWTAAELDGVNTGAGGSNLTVTAIVGGNPGPSATRLLRYDGERPQVGIADGLANDFRLTQQLGGGTVRCCSNNWVNPDYGWSAGAPSVGDALGGVQGVGGVTVTYHAGAASLTNAQLAALPGHPTPGAAGLAASPVNTTYSVVARAADALGNFTLQRLQGVGINPLQTFGHDATAPFDVAVAGGTTIQDRTIFNVNLGFPWTGVDQIQLSASEDFSGFGANPVALRHRAYNAAGTGCSVGSGAACTAVQVPFTITIPNTVPAGGVITEAYYHYEGLVYNQAGLPAAAPVNLWYLFDETPPSVDNISGTAGTFQAGQSYTFSAVATDNVDLKSAQFSLVFTGLTGTNLDAVPLGPPQQLGPGWTAPVTAQATATATVPWISGIETTTGGAPSGTLFPVAWARFVVQDWAENQSTQQNNFVTGSFPAPVSFGPAFPGGATFQQTTAAVDLCFYAANPCTAPGEVRTVTLTATATGASGTFQNPFDMVVFAYVDNIDVGGGEYTHRYIATDNTAVVTDDGTTRTWTWSVELPASALVLDEGLLPYNLPVQAIGVNLTTATALLAATNTNVQVIDN